MFKNSSSSSTDDFDFHAKGLTSLSSLELRSIENWNFSQNLLTSISELPSNFLLKKVDFSNNLIEYYDPNVFQQFNSLQEINLSSNLITKIQNFGCDSIQFIDLSNNRISVIENLENLNELDTLVLCSNRIHSVFLLSPLSFLSTLDLSFNPIDDFPYHNLFPKLTSLSLDHCYLDSFESINQFTRLKHLSLSYNKICEDIILELPLLECLNISHNKITSFCAFIHLASLTSIDISYNKITDSSFSIQESFENVISLNVSGTAITNPLLILKIFPNIQSCEFSNTLISDFRYIISFLQKCNSLSSLDLRNTAFTKNLYFDNQNYKSITEYDSKYPQNKEERHKYRSSILNVIKLTLLDGISTLYEINSAKSEQNDLEILQKLYDEQNDLRQILGLSNLASFIKDLDPSERKEYIKRLSAENDKLKKKINQQNTTSNSAQNELNELIRKNKELHQILHHNYFTEFNETNISKLISLYKDANAKLHEEIRNQRTSVIYKKKRRSREYVIEKCQKALLQLARTTKVSSKKTMLLPESSEEFLMVEGWISAKIFIKIKLKSAIKNICSDIMNEREKTMHWMTLVADTGYKSMDVFQEGATKPMVVSDHMIHIESKLKKHKEAIFLVCAFDNGKVVVDLDQKSQLPDISQYVGKYDSLLFHWKRNQFFYSISPDRVLPLYVVHVVSIES